MSVQEESFNWPKDAMRLRVGDVVRVRSREQILATLDENGRLDGQPCMPEMLQFVGRELRVAKSAHKTCDTITKQGLSRQVDGAVHLEGVRCDGSAHDGCQAGCLMFWRYDWLETLDGKPLRTRPPSRPAGVVVDEQTLHADIDAGVDDKGRKLYRCSATEVLNASRHLSAIDPRQYVADVRTGNATIRDVVRVLRQIAINQFQGLSRRLPRRLRVKDGEFYPFVVGTDDGTHSAPAGLDLQVGESVRVRPRTEILETLDGDQKNRGLYFGAEMLDYCGDDGVVSGRIERIIDETSRRMLKLKDCIVLDGFVCGGQYHRLCPRQDFSYWRESWLDRTADDAVERPSSDTAPVG